MKQYIIHCNEEQLRKLCSAIELQMRVRIGQGFAIVENLCGFAIDENRELYTRLLDDVLKPMTINPDNTLKIPKDWVDRDMWIGICNALGMRTGESSLSKYGLLKVEEVNENGDT